MDPRGNRKSWFAGLMGQNTRTSIKVDEAKEEAARLNREADIRRLYEAGTQQEVLEQLYKPEEVHTCIQKIEQEKDLLKLLEEEEVAEKARRGEAAEMPSIGDDEAIKGGASSQDGSEQDKEGLGQVNCSEGGDAAGARQKSTKFTLRFDSTGEGDGNVKTTVLETAPLDSSSNAVPKDRTMDISLDEVNLLEIGMDSVGINEDSAKNNNGGSARESSNLLGALGGGGGDDDDEPEAEDDLLKELLNTELDESSQFDDDSVTSNADDDVQNGDALQQTEHQDVGSGADGSIVDSTNNESLGGEAPLFTVDKSAIREQSGTTFGSFGSNESGQEAPLRGINNEHSRDQAEKDKSGDSEGGGEKEVSEQSSAPVGQQDAEVPDKEVENGQDATDKSQLETIEPDVASEDNMDAESEVEEIEVDSEDDGEQMETISVEENMDADSEVEEIEIVSEDEGGDMMDDREQMETTSVEDDDELSEDSDSSSSRPPPPPPLLPEDIVEEVVEEIIEDHVETEEEVVSDAESDVVEEIVDEDDDGVVEEVIEEGNDVETEEEVVSDAESDEYAEQVVQRWNDVIEDQPEDLEAAVSALIQIVYKDEEVDVESMLRRTQLPDLYKYLKQQYWYKIHTNKEEAAKAAALVVEEKPTEIVSVDTMLTSRLEGLIANVQKEHRQMEESFSDRSGNVEDDLFVDESVTKDYVTRIKAQGAQGGGRHVGQDYAKAVNNRVQTMPSKGPKEEPPPRAKKVDKRQVEKAVEHEVIEDDFLLVDDDDGEIEEIVDEGSEVEEEVFEEEVLEGSDVEEEAIEDDE